MYVSEMDKTDIARGPKPHFNVELPVASLDCEAFAFPIAAKHFEDSLVSRLSTE